jgi:hypothetical protein
MAWQRVECAGELLEEKQKPARNALKNSCLAGESETDSDRLCQHTMVQLEAPFVAYLRTKSRISDNHFASISLHCSIGEKRGDDQSCRQTRHKPPGASPQS